MCHNIHALRGEEIVRENIKLVRTRLGLTLGQFASLAGVGLSTVANFESGSLESISDRTISRIALGIGLSFEDLVDPTLRGRYKPPSKKLADEDRLPTRAEFVAMLEKMSEDERDDVIKHMRYLIWKRDNP